MIYSVSGVMKIIYPTEWTISEENKVVNQRIEAENGLAAKLKVLEEAEADYFNNTLMPRVAQYAIWETVVAKNVG